MLRGDPRPRISVIVPNYNHAPFLAQRMESIFDQTYTNYEIVLLDDASTDGSQELLEQFAKDSRVSHCIMNEKNSGSPFVQWQKGMDLATGQFIWIAESDDYSVATFLEEVMQPLVHNEAIGIGYCQSRDFGENALPDRLDYTADFKPNIWEEDFTMDGGTFLRNYMSVKNVMPNASAVVFRRRLVQHVQFDRIRDLRMAGDWLFWIQLAQHTRISFISKRLNYFRYHARASRHHDTKQRKLQRLREEYVIRRYLQEDLGVSQEDFYAKLYDRWLGNLNLVDLLNPMSYGLTYHGKRMHSITRLISDVFKTQVGRLLGLHRKPA